MYCTTCGNEVPFGDNYCPNDGTFQQHDLQQHVTSGATPKFCSDCGTSNTDEHLYCMKCGAFQLTLIPFKFERTKEKVAAPSQALPDLSGINKRMALLCAFLAFLLVGIASFIIAESFQGETAYFQDMLNEYTEISPTALIDEFFFYEEDSQLPNNPFTGATDYWMSSHLLNSKLTYTIQEEGEPFKGGVHLQSGSIILLLLPLIALLLCGYFYGRRNKMDTQQYWVSSLLIGIVYGGLTAIVALFAGFSFSGGLTELTTSFSVENNYPFFKALLAGFFIGTIFSFIGSLLGSGTMKSLTSSPLKEGIRTITIGITASIAVVIVLFYGMLFDEFSMLSFETMSTSSFLLLAFQGGFLLWSILNLSTLSLEWNGIGYNDLFLPFSENIQIIYSALSGFKVIPNTEVSMLFNNTGNLQLYMLLGLLIPVALFIWAGYRMQQEGAVQIHRIAMFGFVYALLMSLLVAGTNTGIEFFSSSVSLVELEDAPRAFIGFSAISTFFKCFIFSTLLAIGGAYWKKQRKNRGQVRT